MGRGWKKADYRYKGKEREEKIVQDGTSKELIQKLKKMSVLKCRRVGRGQKLISDCTGIGIKGENVWHVKASDGHWGACICKNKAMIFVV
ncbi:MAG: hypothetical protein ACLTMH_16610 [Faecalimonas umbilicata]|uniref:hypothetical protein n=1 Tax=Faecalimonas umbilicata TaxID=1912855 RepID=UPI003993B0FE